MAVPKNFIALRILATIIIVAGFGMAPPISAVENTKIDALFADVEQKIQTAPEQTVLPLVDLQKFESTLNQSQKNKFYLLKARSLGLRGKFSEQISFIQAKITDVEDADSRAQILYYLSGGYANLGNYEQALIAMNDGIVLLPKLKDLRAKVGVLLSAVTLFNLLGFYDDALLYAERIYNLDSNDPFSVSKCMGIAEKVEINFLKKSSTAARDLLPEAIKTCDGNGRKIISIMMRSSAAIDSIDNKNWEHGLAIALPVLKELSQSSENSHYVIKLEEAISRAYLNLNKLNLAERYGLQAWNRAKLENMDQLLEKISETMAKIKRALGQSDSAMDYFEINLALKKKMLDDQLQKNLAYQRVKFDTQDKVNQLVLAEQKNKTLQVEKTLQQGKNQNLLLLITLSLILLTIVGAWLIRTLWQKNIFKVSSQIDGLTQISNRAYFIDSAKLALKNPVNSVTLILFDMDHFKSINDTFGHSTGDWVLRTVCNVVKSQLRPTDLFGRLGGEEFAICLVNLSEQGVFALAERCRDEVAAIDTKPSGSQFLISASFGIATHGVRGNTSFEDILAAADKALYFSKNGGRNVVSVFQ